MDQFLGNLAPPVSILSLSFSPSLPLLFRLNSHLKHKGSLCLLFLPGLLRPKWGGALCLCFFGRLGGCLWPNVDGASLLSRDFIGFLCKPRNLSPFFSIILFSSNLSLYL